MKNSIVIYNASVFSSVMLVYYTFMLTESVQNIMFVHVIKNTYTDIDTRTHKYRDVQEQEWMWLVQKQHMHTEKYCCNYGSFLI